MLSFANQEKILSQILKRNSNSNCADCNAISPTWASLDFGVFICPNCSGAHRSLGPTVTRVKSTKLDSWHSDWVNNMQIGNKQVNNFWEAKLTAKKPNSQSSLDQLKKYVVDKYIRKKYVGSGEDPLTSHKNGNSKKTKEIKQEVVLKKDQKLQSNYSKSSNKCQNTPQIKKQSNRNQDHDFLSFDQTHPQPKQEKCFSQTSPQVQQQDDQFGNYTQSTPTNEPQTTISTTQCITFNDLLSINRSQNRRNMANNTIFHGHNNLNNHYYNQLPLHSHNHMNYMPNMPYLHKSQSQSHNYQMYHHPNQHGYPQNGDYYQNNQHFNIPCNLRKDLSSNSNNLWQH